MALYSRVRWLKALLLVAGGWMCTAFLIVLLLEQRQQYLGGNYPPHKVVLAEAKNPPCDCTHHNATVSSKTSGSNSSKESEHRTSDVKNQTPKRLSVIGQDLANGVPRYFVQPKPSEGVWPRLNETSDRVLAQINLVPNTGQTIVRISLMGKFTQIKRGKEQFVMDSCPVQQCEIVSHDQQHSANVLVFDRETGSDRNKWRPDQILVWYMLESPMNGPKVPPDTFNWTATFRRDSTINTPYERFTFYRNFTGTLPPPSRNYAEGKSKMAAWFVSNCNTDNGRHKYVAELQKYLEVDIYGMCGDKHCPRKSRHCQEMLTKDYKFYLAFENSNCVDYITEKFFWNGLLNDVVPVVFGARPEDYAAVAPPHSYIHVDDFASPRDLADYLIQLNTDHQKYNEYFRWKGSGEFLNTKFWCRLCALAHEATRTDTRLYYRDFQKWWAGDGVCLKPDGTTSWLSWKYQPRQYHHMDNDTLQHIT